MPKLPDATAFGARPTPDVGGRRQIIGLPSNESLAAPIQRAAAAQESYANSAGQGTESLANAAFKYAQVNERLLAVQRGVQVDSALTRAAADMKVFTLDLKNDPNVATYGQRFQDRSKQIFETYSKNLDEQGQAEFQAKYEPLMLDQALKVREIGSAKVMDQSVAQLDQNLEETAQLASKAGSKAEYDKLVANGVMSVDKMMQAGMITAVDGGKRIRNFQSRLDEIKVMQLIQNNPGQASAMLANPNMFSHIDPLRRESLANSAFSHSVEMMRLSNAIADRNDRLADKRLKQQSDLTAKDGWDLVRNGTLTADWLDQNKSKLDQGDYVALTKAFSGETGRDNPTVVRDLTDRLATEDITKDAGRALENHDISVNTYQSLVGKNRTALADDRPASPYKSGRSAVQTATDPGSLLMGPAEQAGKIAQSNAMTEYDSWAQSKIDVGHTITREEALQEAQAVIQRYQAVEWKNIALTLGLPRFYSGTRDALDTKALDEAERQAWAANETGKMSQEQLVEEIQKIKNWRGILEIQSRNTTGGKGRLPSTPPAFNAAKPGGGQ